MDAQPSRRFRFGLRTLFELIAVAAFILTLIYYRQPRTDQPPAEMTGRYQLEEVENRALILDTKTGELWRLSSDASQWYRPPKLPGR